MPLLLASSTFNIQRIHRSIFLSLTRWTNLLVGWPANWIMHYSYLCTHTLPLNLSFLQQKNFCCFFPYLQLVELFLNILLLSKRQFPFYFNCDPVEKSVSTSKYKFERLGWLCYSKWKETGRRKGICWVTIAIERKKDELWSSCLSLTASWVKFEEGADFASSTLDSFTHCAHLFFFSSIYLFSGASIRTYSNSEQSINTEP